MEDDKAAALLDEVWQLMLFRKNDYRNSAIMRISPDCLDKSFCLKFRLAQVYNQCMESFLAIVQPLPEIVGRASKTY